MTRTISGAKVVFKVNGLAVAYANALTFEWLLDYVPIDTIDTISTVEYAENAETISFSCTMFRVYRKTAVSMKLQPKIANILKQPTLLVTFIDKTTGNALMTIEDCKMIGRTMSVNARGMWQEILTFKGLTASDEEGS